MTLRDQRQAEFAKAWKDTGEYGILYLCPRFGKIRTSINVLKEFPKDASVLIAYPDNKIKQSWLDDFEALGYDKAQYGCWAPDTGAVGLILSETVSRTSGKIYVMFKEYEGERIGVINKEAMEPTEAEDQRIWSTSRNNIKIGRLVRGKIKVSDTYLPPNFAKCPFLSGNISSFF